MRAHDRTSRRPRKLGRTRLALAARFGFWLILVCAPAHLRADPPTRDAAPVDLAGWSVRVWQDGSDQWVYLAGQAAALQGVEGLRSDEAIVRVVEESSARGPLYRVEVYAESLLPDARPPAGKATPARRKAARAMFRTEAPPRLKPYESKGLVRLPAPPRSLPILTRSGLGARPPDHPQAPGQNVLRNAQAGQQAATPAVERFAARKPVADTTKPAIPDIMAPSPPGGLVDSQPQPAVIRDSAVIPAQFSPPGNGAPAGAAGNNLELPPPVELPDATPSTPVSLQPPIEVQDPVPAAPNRLSPPIEVDPQPPDGVLLPPPVDAQPPIDAVPVPNPNRALGEPQPPTNLEPLPDSAVPRRPRAGAPEANQPPSLPFLPDTQRVTRIFPRNGGPDFQIRSLPIADGQETWVIVGGVNIITSAPQFGIVDISADSVIMWRKLDKDGKGATLDEDGSQRDSGKQPLEFYLEGNVIIRQDERKVAGNADQKTYRANQAYYEVGTERLVALDGELFMMAPGLVTPARITAPRIDQFKALEPDEMGKLVPGLAQVRADTTMMTGSRFPTPGYRITSSSIDATRVKSTKKRKPNTNESLIDSRSPPTPNDLTWRITARQNFFWMGPVPFFYWPKFEATVDDFEPPLRQIMFATNNYFGQQLRTDWNGHRLLGIQKPLNIDLWNLDLDYLSRRTKEFPAVGSEIGWNGRDLINDFADPYGQVKGAVPNTFYDYFGYFDIWGLRDAAPDNLGTGPAVITNNVKAGSAGYQRNSVPAFVDDRFHFNVRHMQRFIPDDEEHYYEDLRAQIELAYVTDRNFIEEYYKRLFDIGSDQETVAYGIRQKDNWAATIWAEANLQSWYTDTQWLPRLDYYRLGDSLLNNRITYFTHSGIDYGNTHTDDMVNNKNLFAFIPYDPISNTSGVLKAGRAYTTHEFDAPLRISDIFRVVPYVQGQAVGWTNQINGEDMGRVWGAAGARLEAMAWKVYPGVESEWFNVHGLNHKINFEADYRNAVSNQKLNSIGVQDDLDDNTYEYVRRYFALTNYAGGILPPQYDPRHLILRRAISPITGTTDVQGTLDSLHLGVHQRLQTKRGPEGKRRIIDYMTLDFDTTYFPYANRDNFGKPFGQNMYLWQWFLGDRTSIVSYGWFEFWKLGGEPIFTTNVDRHNDPFGLNVVTSGISISRPPRGNIFLGYTVIDSGPITTSALNFTSSYWLSPKWYASLGTSYDFGNAILLGGNATITRIGADYLTVIGINGDPQRSSYQFAVSISPRLEPEHARFQRELGHEHIRYALRSDPVSRVISRLECLRNC